MEISFFGSLACAAEVSVLQALSGGVPEGACIGVGAGTVAIVGLVLAAEALALLWVVRRARARRTPAPVDPGPVWSAGGRDGGPIR